VRMGVNEILLSWEVVYPFRISGVGEGRYVSNGDPDLSIHRMRVKIEKNTNPDHKGFKLYVCPVRAGAWPLETGSSEDFYHKFYIFVEWAVNLMASLHFPFAKNALDLVYSLLSGYDSEIAHDCLAISYICMVLCGLRHGMGRKKVRLHGRPCIKHLKSFVEVDIFVFNSTSGAQRFYNYTVNKEQSISGIREKAAVTLTETATIHLARLSNVVIEAIAWNGGGGKIVERIAGKVECRDKEMAYLEEERPKPHEPKISWALKNSTRFGNNNAYVAGSLALLGCTWINSREGYECTYAIVVAGETRDSKGDPIKACSAQRLEIKEQNNTGNQTMLISYDPPYLGAWPGAWHHKGYLWNYYDDYYSSLKNTSTYFTYTHPDLY